MELSQLYEGKIVRVYTDGGTIFAGKAHFHDDWVTIFDIKKSEERNATVHLNHVVAFQYQKSGNG